MKISELTVLGTHDSATYNLRGLSGILAKTQNLTIKEQLEFGVRYFDIRLNYDKDGMQCYHGLAKCNVSWKSVLDEFRKFLKSNPTDTVFLRVLRADNETFKRKITDAEWHIRFALESDGVLVVEDDVELNVVKGQIAVINLNWQRMAPQKMNMGYGYDCKESDVTAMIEECNAFSDEKFDGIKLVYTNADGSFPIFNNIKWLKKIPHPRGFFNMFNKRIGELKTVENNWYIFDFIEEVG